MFSDLVGSTALATQVDPEDLREVIRAYHRSVTEVIRRFGGHVARYMGDGALVYFGYPTAHEDDPERAVRAALAAVETVSGLSLLNGYRPQIRVGIATGLVVVGDIVGDGSAPGLDIAGEAPNLAARLQTAAEPSSVLIDARTRQLLGDLFECRAIENLLLKGFKETLPVYQVLRASGIESRSHALRRTTLTPMINRNKEVEMLARLWTRAKAKQGQVVLLSGEAGIGKSRILAALEEGIAGEPHIHLGYFCSPFHIDSALYPIVRQIEAAAKFQRDDPPHTKLDKLAGLLAGAAEEPDELALIASLMAIPNVGYPNLDLTPAKRKERTLGALLSQLDGLTARLPLLITFEDVHWADPTTRELLDMMVARARRLPILIVISFRLEFQPRWSALPHVTTIELPRLGPTDRVSLLQSVAHNKSLPSEVLTQLLQRTDGIPLFMEEMTKAVLDSGLMQEEASRYVLKSSPQELGIPTSLHASLMARFAGLSSAHELAQSGAAIGREFSYPILAAITDLPEGKLRETLDRLTETELVFAEGEPPDATYRFKHALVRDAIYDTLLREKRPQLHARIGRALEERFPELSETEPDILAHHFTQAGATEKAVGYWTKAGRRAIERSAMAEAVALLRRGLELLPRLPDTRERSRHELGLQLALGNALIAHDGYTAPETGRVYDRARVLCDLLGDTENLIRVAHGQWSFYLMRADMPGAEKVAGELLNRLRRHSAPALGLTAHRLLGTTLLQLGRLDAARTHLETAHRILARRRAADRMVGGNDARVGIPAYRSIVLALLGRYKEAHAQAALALAEAQRGYRPHRYAFALSVAGCWFHVVMDEDAPELCQALATVSEEQDFPFWATIATVWHGLALAKAGQVREGIALVRQGAANHHAMGAAWGLEFFFGTAAAYANGQEGLDLIDDALRQVTRTGIRWFEPELHRIRGQILEKRGDDNLATDCYSRALKQARGQKSRHWELRAALSLAQLRRREGRPAIARRVLATTYGQFKDRSASSDLRTAGELLAGLNGREASTTRSRKAEHAG